MDNIQECVDCVMINSTNQSNMKQEIILNF